MTVLNADGSRTETVTDRNADNTLRDQMVTTISADGRSITIQRNTNGDSALDQTESITTAANGTVVDTIVNLNPDGTSASSATTTISADGRTRITYQDLNADGVVDATSTLVTVLNADGSTTDDLNAHVGSRLVETKRIVTSADGRTVATACDLDGNGSTDLTTSDVTVVNADGSQVNTAAQRNGNGSLRTQTVTTTSADQRTIGITRDVNGDGAIDQTETIVIQANGSTVDTVSTFNANGSLKDRKITTTSANGLSTTTQLDLNGDGAIDETLTDVIVLNGDGSRTETFTDYNGTTSGSIKDRVVTTTSANGLSSTVQWSGAIGQESLNQTQTDVTVVNADGSLIETISDFTPAGVLKDRKVVTTAANGLSTTTQLDLDGNGSFERVDAIVFGVDGSKTETITRSNSSNGALLQKDVLATSADGRSRSLQRDTDGNGSFDHYESAATNLDGGTTGTIWNTKANGALKDKVIAIRSADGLTTTVRTDCNGDGTIDYTWTTAADLNADGSRVDTTSWVNGNGTLWNQAVTTTSANGLSKATRIDTNGDGVLDQVRYETTVINTDGTTTETVSDIYCADGSLKSRSVRTVSADGNTRTTQVDDNGDGTVDRTIVAVLAADGSETLSEIYFNPDGTLKAQATAAISFDGRTTTILKSGAILRSDSITETTTVAADGSGSYSWVQVRFDNTTTGYASHVIDAAGVDTWTWSEEPTGVTPPVGDGGGTIAIPYASIRIDLATETRYLEIANRLYDTAFDRDMFRDEREFLAKYIGNGVFNTTALANDLMNSVEFSQRYGDPAVPRPDVPVERTIHRARLPECPRTRRIARRIVELPVAVDGGNHDARGRDVRRLRKRGARCGGQRSCHHQQHGHGEQQLLARSYDG